MAVVIQTDIGWPDDRIERAVIEAAGHEFLSGPTTPPSPADIEALVAAHDPSAIMTCWAQVSPAAISAPTALRIVQRVGVGLDNIAVEAATARGAWVANVPDYCVPEVSDHAVALLLDWARGISAFDRKVKEGSWNPAGARLRRLGDLTVGILGLGRIGRSTADKLRAFGCRVLVHTRTPSADDPGHVALGKLLAESDAVIIHAPLTPQTHHLFDAARIAQMRRGAFLINVSRGGIIRNDALLSALEQGHLSGAGLDVVDGEPDVPRALVERADVVVTPHIAFSSDASLADLRRCAAEEVVRVLAGAPPRNPCNRPEGLS